MLLSYLNETLEKKGREIEKVSMYDKDLLEIENEGLIVLFHWDNKLNMIYTVYIFL